MEMPLNESGYALTHLQSVPQPAAKRSAKKKKPPDRKETRETRRREEIEISRRQEKQENRRQAEEEGREEGREKGRDQEKGCDEKEGEEVEALKPGIGDRGSRHRARRAILLAAPL